MPDAAHIEGGRVFLASDPTLWALWSLALALCATAAIGFVGAAPVSYTHLTLPTKA